jgi:predicted nucleotidyltransferase
MNDKELRTMEKFKSLVSERVKVHEVRAFGSRARGDAAEDSDMDVLVVVDSLDHATERCISDCAWEAGFPEDIIIVPIVLSLDVLKNSPLRESAFIKGVYREGVAI